KRISNSNSNSNSNNNSSSSSKTRTSRIKRISSRHKTSSRRTSRGATKTKRNNSKKTNLRRKTNRKRNSSNNLARVHLPHPPQKSSRIISLRHGRANGRPNNHLVLAKEKTKIPRPHPEKATRKTPPPLQPNHRKRN